MINETKTCENCCPKPGPYFAKGTVAAFALIILDQLTKWLVFEKLLRVSGTHASLSVWLTQDKTAADYMAEYANFQTVKLLPFLDFTMVWNRGVSFGLFSGGAEKTPYILSAVAIILSAGLLGWLWVTRTRLIACGLALIISGAIGNLIDRLHYGAVADFVDFYIGAWHWPAFNLADSAIVIGAMLLIVDSFFNKDATT